jgi:hypothetical protein
VFRSIRRKNVKKEYEAKRKSMRKERKGRRKNKEPKKKKLPPYHNYFFCKQQVQI